MEDRKKDVIQHPLFLFGRSETEWKSFLHWSFAKKSLKFNVKVIEEKLQMYVFSSLNNPVQVWTIRRLLAVFWAQIYQKRRHSFPERQSWICLKLIQDATPNNFRPWIFCLIKSHWKSMKIYYVKYKITKLFIITIVLWISHV